MVIRLMLVDDHQIVREGLRSLLAKEMDIQVVGEAEDGRDALRLCGELKPDVVVMDVSMQGLNGIDATRELTTSFPDVRVLALSMHSDRRYVSDMLAAGARGYLMKDSAYDELALAVRLIWRDSRISPRLWPKSSSRTTSRVSRAQRRTLFRPRRCSRPASARCFSLSVRDIRPNRPRRCCI